MIVYEPGERFAAHLAHLLAAGSGLPAGSRSAFTDMVERLVVSMNEGHSCLPLDRKEQELSEQSPLVGMTKKCPLVLFAGRLYLRRYFCHEAYLADRLGQMAETGVKMGENEKYLDSFFASDSCDPLQREAGRLALEKELSIISGGPGTGKTTTVARIIGLLLQVYGCNLKIALAAPTGKAAIRLQQSLHSAYSFLQLYELEGLKLPDTATTIHRLLGVRLGSILFRHDERNPVDADVVIIDEASMIDLALMRRMAEALKKGTKLIMLGDKDQLASVESGAVLADLIEALPENTVVLKKTYRFDGDIGAVASAVNDGNLSALMKHLAEPGNKKVELNESLSLPGLSCGFRDYFAALKKRRIGDYGVIFAVFSTYRILCGTRIGPRGTERINRIVEQELQQYMGDRNEWYPGRPVMILENSYALGLYNGDIGICLEDDKGALRVWFETGDGGLKPFLPSRLPAITSAFAMTIHKSQGSEFDEVALVLPEEEVKLLTRELLYTGLTRARKKVCIYSTEAVLMTGVLRKTERRSGLSLLLKRGVADLCSL